MSNRNISSFEAFVVPDRRLKGIAQPAIDYCASVWRQFDIPPPRVALFPQVGAVQRGDLGEIFRVTDDDDVDAILLTDEQYASALDGFRRARNLVLAPVINVTGSPCHIAEVDFDIADPQSVISTASVIRKFSSRRARLSPRFLRVDSPASRMLAYLFVSGDALSPVRVPESRYFFALRGFYDTHSTVLVAEALANRGWLERSFVDRHHECDNCRSHRLVVREECPACRSANLTESDLIHHYSCAQLGLEAAFRSGNSLICPKCRKLLRNYGKDYDKPGSVQLCGECSHTTSEPVVGFVCQDCAASIDGQKVRSVDLYSYALSEYALSQLTEVKTPPTLYPPSHILHDCPDGLQKELRATANNLPLRHDSVVAEVIYEAREEVTNRRGEATFKALRKLYAQNLQGLLAGLGSVHSSDERDFVLFYHFTQADRDTDAQAILNICEAVLSDPVHPKLRILWDGSSEAAS